MSLLAPFDARSIELARARVRPSPDVRSRARRDAVVEFLVHALLSDSIVAASVVARLEAAVDESVVVWSPSMYTTSRTELITELLECDDAITGITAHIERRSDTGSTVFVEWSLEGRFSNAAFLDDDVLVEPSGRSVTTNGIMTISFAGERVDRIHCYYDRAALVDQLLA